MSRSVFMIAAYDLGTGGLKASLHRTNGQSVADVFLSYSTYYPAENCREQKPKDWWEAVCRATKMLLAEHPEAKIICAALSGQSIAPVLLDKEGELALDQIPIWSDARATAEAEEFLALTGYRKWYMLTGNGDPPETYTAPKLMWLRNHQKEAWDRTAKVVGSKDYINYRLTGEIATDCSYASGSGLFDLKTLSYREEFLRAANISRAMLPDICDAHQVVGKVTSAAASATGLPAGIPVACGGVDNACMALGAIGVGEGRIYTSLGSSAWIAVTSSTPTLDFDSKPFIFAHVERGYYTSGVSIFSAGNAYRWASEQLCGDLPAEERYSVMDRLAGDVPPGAGGVLFSPALAGGSSQEPGTALRGGFAGLSMGSTRSHMLRAVLEGVALSLNCYCLETLRKKVRVKGDMLFCGGGAKSSLWNQIFADVFGMNIILRGDEQGAASLGAAAIAARAAGIWEDYSPLESLFSETERLLPNNEVHAFYSSIGKVFMEWTETFTHTCERLQAFTQKEEAIHSQRKE